MKKIVKKDVICKQLEKLPISWGTLHTISLMDENDIQSAIDNVTFTPKTTKKEVEEYRKSRKTGSSTIAQPSSSPVNDNELTPSLTVCSGALPSDKSRIRVRFKTGDKIDQSVATEIKQAINFLKKFNFNFFEKFSKVLSNL